MINPNNINKYKIELPRKQPRLKQKTTGISWDELVEVIHVNGIGIAKKIRLHNIGVPTGTSQISGDQMLELWKAVSRRKPN